MATTSSGRTAGTWVPDLRWKRGLGVAALAAALSGVPVLARDAVAQRSTSIQAAAYVTTSYLGARFRSDTTEVAAAGASQLAVQRLRLGGLGVLDVQTGPGEQVRVGSRTDVPANRSTVVIQIAYVST